MFNERECVWERDTYTDTDNGAHDFVPSDASDEKLRPMRLLLQFFFFFCLSVRLSMHFVQKSKLFYAHL